MSDENNLAELKSSLEAMKAEAATKVIDAAFKKYIALEKEESVDSKMAEWQRNAVLYGVGFLMLNSKGEVRVLKPEEYTQIGIPKNILDC